MSNAPKTCEIKNRLMQMMKHRIAKDATNFGVGTLVCRFGSVKDAARLSQTAQFL
jgi:hypothetical protein